MYKYKGIVIFKIQISLTGTFLLKIKYLYNFNKFYKSAVQAEFWNFNEVYLCQIVNIFFAITDKGFAFLFSIIWSIIKELKKKNQILIINW